MIENQQNEGAVISQWMIGLCLPSFHPAVPSLNPPGQICYFYAKLFSKTDCCILNGLVLLFYFTIAQVESEIMWLQKIGVKKQENVVPSFKFHNIFLH